MNAKGVAVEFVKESLKFTGAADPMAELMLTMLAAFAQFERSMIKERQREGIAIAKGKGVYKGGTPKLSTTQIAELRARCANGEKDKAAIARAFGISRVSLYR